MQDKRYCPYCGQEVWDATGKTCFVEYGAYDNEDQAFDEEFEIEEYCCAKCLRTFYLRSDGV